jgi:hypothetical protein
MDSDREVDELLEVAKVIGYGEIPPYQHNECFTSGAFDLIVFNGSDTARKFDLLTRLCDRYAAVEPDAKFLKGYLYLLEQVAYATQTTERPRGMQKILEENPEAARALRVWYREPKEC